MREAEDNGELCEAATWRGKYFTFPFPFGGCLLCLSKASFSARLRHVVQRWCRRNREGGAPDAA